MAQEKYPSSCPWDFGPTQELSHLEEWTLINGDEFVTFARVKDDQNWFTIRRNGEDDERFLSYQARLTYQKLLEKGFKLKSA